MPRTEKKATAKKSVKRHATQQSVDQAVKSICDIMRRGNCAGAMQYVPELTWILFLRILDEREQREEQESAAVGGDFRPSLSSPFRWRDWGAPPADGAKEPEPGWKRAALKKSASGSFFNFVNAELLPLLKKLKNVPDATPRQKVISEIMTGVERVRIDTERNFQDVLDKVHQLTTEAIDTTHVFTLSQVYEGLLLKMGEKGNDGGQFFTPRQVITTMVKVINPQVDETIYDPSCGTGGFLAQSYEHIQSHLGKTVNASQLENLKHNGFFGREKENLIYPIALANLVLHGIDKPNLWHGNTLTGQEIYGGLFSEAPQTFDVILTNPPFGGKEGPDAQTNFDYKTGATQVLFLQHIIRSLGNGGRCGIVLDEGLLFRTNEESFTKTKRKLLDECDLWCVVSLPGGVFTAAGAGVKTNLLFFNKGQPTSKIWYYDMTDVKILKKTPLTLAHFDTFFKLLPERAESPLSWTVDMDERKRIASEEAEPLKAHAASKARQAAQVADQLKELKKAKPLTPDAVKKTETNFSALTKEARELTAKAEEILSAVYDLKAVNPNRKPVVDDRTPEDLIALIESKGYEIAEALATLKNV
jgi:type I restriction enzyme M protein